MSKRNPVTVGLVIGLFVSAFLLGGLPVLLLLCLFLAGGPEGHPSTALFILGLYAHLVAIPPIVGGILGWFIRLACEFSRTA